MEIKSTPAAATQSKDDDDDDDGGDIPDMEEFKVDEHVVKADLVFISVDISFSCCVSSCQATLSLDDKVLKTRTYDITITYDLYYKTPKVWLYGYDEVRRVDVSMIHILQEQRAASTRQGVPGHQPRPR